MYNNLKGIMRIFKEKLIDILSIQNNYPKCLLDKEK